MKRTAKIVSVVLIVMLVFAFAACKKEQNTASKDDYIGKPFDKDFDMAVKIDGKAYPVRVDSSEVLKALGDDYEMDQVVSCVYDGYDKTFTYKGIVVSTVPDGDKDIIEMFTVNGEGYLTTRDIGVGSTRDEVIKAYGDKYYDDGYYLTYSESGDESNIADMRIQFCFENDVVTEFFIYSPSYSN